MKKSFVLVIFVLVSFVFVNICYSEASRVAKIVEIKGKAEVFRAGKWINAEKDMILTEEEIIRTERRSEVLLNLDGDAQTATLQLSEESELHLNRLKTIKDKKDILLELAIGKVLIRAKELSAESKFEVKTPTAVVGVRGTKFAVEVKAVD